MQCRLVASIDIFEGIVLCRELALRWEGGLSGALGKVSEDARDFLEESFAVEAPDDYDRHPLGARPQVGVEVDHVGEAEGTCFGFGLRFALGDVGAEDAIQTTL